MTAARSAFQIAAGLDADGHYLDGDDGARICACGCGVALNGHRADARFANPACRLRAWRRSRETANGVPRLPDGAERRKAAGGRGQALAARPARSSERETAGVGP
jgi:hypothetical protein